MHDRWNAFVDLDPAARTGEGPLSDLTVGVKSNIMVVGLPWTAGMGLHRNRIASRDAEVVRRLRDAGALILGTVNMHEAALGATTDNAFYGRTHNPHRHGHTPGGSSGGSGAAVAAGLCDVALGTDTLGSIRIPAAYCGVYGLKPTNGAVPNDGLAMLEPVFDCIGPLATSLATIGRVWSVIGNAMGRSPELVRFLMLDGFGEVALEPAVRDAFAATCRAIGRPLTPITLPHDLAATRMAGFVASARWLIADLGAEYRPDNPMLSDELKFILSLCEQHERRPDVLWETRAALIEAIGDDGVLVMPTAPHVAFAHGGRASANQADFTALANIAGLPALSIPAGWSEDGLPVGMQLVGPINSETALIALASEIDTKLAAYRPPADFGRRT